MPKKIVKDFISNKGIIKKAYKKLTVISDADSLDEIRISRSGSELEKKKSDETNGDIYCTRIDDQYRICFRESYNQNESLVAKDVEITKHYKNSKLFPEGYKP